MLSILLVRCGPADPQLNKDTIQLTSVAPRPAIYHDSEATTDLRSPKRARIYQAEGTRTPSAPTTPTTPLSRPIGVRSTRDVGLPATGPTSTEGPVQMADGEALAATEHVRPKDYLDGMNFFEVMS